MKFFYFLVLFLWTPVLFSLMSVAAAATQLQKNPLDRSTQLLLVKTPAVEAVSGQLQRYKRNARSQWIKVGGEESVVVGKNGLAWGIDAPSHPRGLIKKEGDGKTPMGMYAIGPAFGFHPTSRLGLSYFPLTDSSLCVDDEKSQYYNQLINSLRTSSQDWKSGERMRAVPLYEQGAFIQYNVFPPIRGAGSCIFLHIWRAANHGTAGCIAMDKFKLKKILHWLKAKDHPVIIALSQSDYEKVKNAWQLP